MMVRQQITLGEEAQNLLDALVEIFDTTRSSIVEALILDHCDEYAQARKVQLDAWLEDQEEDLEEE